MDGNTNVYDSITVSKESEVIPEETNTKIGETVILENEINLEKTQHDEEISRKSVEVNSNVTNIEDHDLSIKTTENIIVNEKESVPTETTNISVDTKENPTGISSAGQQTLDTSIGYNLDDTLKSTIADNKDVNQDINSLQSNAESSVTTQADIENVSQSAEEIVEGKHDEMGPNLEHSDNVSVEEASIEKVTDSSCADINLPEKIDDLVENEPSITDNQTLESEKANEDLKCSNVTTNTTENDRNIEEFNNACSEKTKDQEDQIANENIALINNENENEVIIYNDQLIENTAREDSNISEIDTKLSEQTETIEDQVQSIHDPEVDNENGQQKLIDQEFAGITHETTEKPKETVQDIGQQDNIDTNTVTESIAINNDDQVVTKSVVADGDNIEKRMLSIVQEEPQEVHEKAEKTMSIVEAIQRDFDETDSEEIDKPDNVEESEPPEVAQDNVMVGVNISDQLQHGTVTVTDTSGQVYYVQSVEDLIVVENDDLSTTLDQPETLEVTVLSEESVQQQSESQKAKERPPIPSHILGRNIDNPVIDTFRNGKVPPKPRLGVKIPYKNLTSQIVSKDELAKEILDRQKHKYTVSGQTTKEMLFAKKLTQRLAKKIVPTPTVALDKNTQPSINNSDLLAILEGDGDDAKLACTSKSNVSSSLDIKKEQNLPIKKEKIVNKPVMTKTVERELALKQLREVSTGIPRHRWSSPKMPLRKGRREPEIQITVVENDYSIAESPVTPVNQEQTKNIEQVVHSKVNDNIEEIVTKSDEPKSNIKRKSSSLLEPEISKRTEAKVLTANKLDTLEAKPVEVKVGKVEEADVTNSVVKSKPVDTETKKNELKQPISSELALEKEQVNPKAKANDIKEIPKLLSTDVQAKTTSVPVVKLEKSTFTTDKTKTVEVNAAVNQNDDNPKKNDVNTKPILAKVTESNKLPSKVDLATPDVKDEYVERKLISNPPVKTYTRKRKSTEDPSILSNVPDKKPIIMQKDINIPPNTYITKSSRVIKRKVIWDPDEPSTARSLARFTRPDLIKSEKPTKLEVSPIKPDKKAVVKPTVKVETIASPSRSPDNQKTKKRLSEIDKLLMDEGAVNMLYAFKNIDDTIKKKKTVISLDKAQRELMNKTNELIKDLKTNSDKISPKSLRRKGSPIPSPSKKPVPALISRKKSKDSNRSSLHSPPASPGMIFLNHAEASRIIRRHSSSSYSSLEGDIDASKKVETDAQAIKSTDSEKISKKRIASSGTESNKIKKTKRTTEKQNVTIDIQKAKTNEETAKNFSKVVEGETTKESKYNKYKTFSVREMDQMVQIILLPSFNNEAYLTTEILNELSNIIKELQDDVNCTVVLISSSASSFCHGINYKTLLSDKEQSRRTFARKLAQCVTNFLRILATFTKILVAGVHGDTVGLGVTILPLFDMVIASDTATFSIPNARLGCAAEGGSLLSLPHLMHNVLVSELLYASRKLIAAEALRLGMVTRVLWPDKFQQELVSIVKGISYHSRQFMELTKKQLRQRMVLHIESVLDKEVDTLVHHWTSSECQKNFGVYG